MGRKKARPAADAAAPPAVPVLAAADVCRSWATQAGRRDLGEWLDAVFPETGYDDPPRRRAYRALCRVLSERLGRPVTVLWLFLEYQKKHRFPSLAWQAACWNEALARLGYDVPAPARADPGKESAACG